jgi:hypothetical protein
MPRPEGGFRLRGKKILLTYSKSGPLDKKLLHEFINKKLKQEVSIKICHEHHQDGDIHTHVVIFCQRSVDVQSERFFDYMGKHPNIKPPSNDQHWKNQINYVDKEDEHVYTWGEIEIPINKDELFAEACEYVKNCKSLKQMYTMSPHLKTISSKVTFFENYWRTQHKKKSTHGSFQMTSFNKAPISDWTTSWLVWGKAGSGKTQWALAHFKNPLLVSHMDDLKEFDEDEHDGIVFDDMSFKHLPGQAIIHLLDIDMDRSIHCRFVNATIPAKTKKIFCHNNADIFVPEKDTSEEQMNGISRRYQSVHIDDLLY